MLHLHHANRLEDLAEELRRNLETPISEVLTPEIIAVPSTAISEWLTICIAAETGISANIRWLLPARLLWQIFRDALDEVPDSNAFSADALAWRVLPVLDDSTFTSRHSALSRYLKDSSELHRWQLARQMGRLYEQYLVFRPDWVLDWESSEAAHWQGALWQRLISQGDTRHWLRWRDELFERLHAGSIDEGVLPERLSLFALTGLSPAFLELVATVARYTQVHLYHLNFSEGYWAEIVSDRERARLLALQGEQADAYLDQGNRLLASMGRLGRETLVQLIGMEAIESETYQAPGRSTLLGVIQTDLVELLDSRQAAPPELDTDDHSIEVHVCHGPMREVEVLHDQLLDAFARDPSLTPADVRVFIPRLGDYAPLIESVFGSATGTRHVPFALAEHALTEQSALVQGFLTLLRLPQGRLDAREIDALLDLPMLQRRFSLTQTDVEQILKWIETLGIHWGVDAKELQSMSVSVNPEHTWRGGTDRLLMGFALGDTGSVYKGYLPVLPGDSSLADMVGRWRGFLEQVITLRQTLSGVYSLSRWIAICHQIVDRFFAPDESEMDNVVRLRQRLAGLASDGLIGGFVGPLSLPVLRDAVERRIGEVVGGRFMSGGVTFATLAHGRCIPARLICLLGMNGDHFPGRESTQGLDQMSLEPRVGDRLRRDEDRLAFLEVLSSARSSLYISYTGASARDDTVQPPSIVISELLEEIDALTRDPNRSEKLTVRHPLQPFSERYFDGSAGLFSYAEEMVPPETVFTQDTPPLFEVALDLPEPGDLPLDRLVDFLANPARALLKGRLNITLEPGVDLLSIREPMALDPRGRRALERDALDAKLSEEELVLFIERARLGGALPSGTPGVLAAQQAWTQATPVITHLAPLLDKEPGQTVAVETSLEGWRLNGVLENVGPNGQVLWSVDALSPWVMLRAWCAHLLLNCDPAAPSHQTHLVDAAGVILFSPQEDAVAKLGRLVEVFREGLCRPVPFFPRSAWAYMSAAKTPLANAYRTWAGSEHASAPGESADPFFALAFRDRLDTALDSEFESLALQIFETPAQMVKEARG
ncbi:MAG TPA: exodeoxyribonuclease V subunit gamma [Gammaproteobacteria bacterium]|nr:exodeoxyribonuclease V subunit gamma [Gammaproteobacteria bacterium]